MIMTVGLKSLALAGLCISLGMGELISLLASLIYSSLSMIWGTAFTCESSVESIFNGGGTSSSFLGLVCIELTSEAVGTGGFLLSLSFKADFKVKPDADGLLFALSDV